MTIDQNAGGLRPQPVRNHVVSEETRHAMPTPQARLVIALPHARLRNAIAAALASSGAVSVVGEAGSLTDAVRRTRESKPDGLVLGSGLLRGDVAGDLRRLIAELPSVEIVVVGTETSAGYAAAIKAAGAADYVAFDTGTEGVVSAVTRAIPERRGAAV